MAYVPTTGPRLFPQILPAPRSLTALYRGGATVPNVTATSSIPTTGPISISNFAGLSYYSNVFFWANPGTVNVSVPTFETFHTFTNEYVSGGFFVVGCGVWGVYGSAVTLVSGTNCVSFTGTSGDGFAIRLEQTVAASSGVYDVNMFVAIDDGGGPINVPLHPVRFSVTT